MQLTYPENENHENEKPLTADDLNLDPPDETQPVEGDWDDEEDEDFDDRAENLDDLREIRAGDDLGEPDPDDDDHLPEEELQ